MNRERLRNLRRENTDLLTTQGSLQDRIQAQQQQIQVRQLQFHGREYRAHRADHPQPTLTAKLLHDTIMHVLIDQNQRDLRRLHNISQRRAQIRDELRAAGVSELELDSEMGWLWFSLTVKFQSSWVTDLVARFWLWFWGDQGPFSHWIVLYICGLFRGFWGELLQYLDLIWQLGAAF